MKLKQGYLYTVPNSTYNVYVKKIQHVSDTYTKAKLEFVSKDKWWKVYYTFNAKLVHESIIHWRIVDDN